MQAKALSALWRQAMSLMLAAGLFIALADGFGMKQTVQPVDESTLMKAFWWD